jgi:hypothetical protein
VSDVRVPEKWVRSEKNHQRARQARVDENNVRLDRRRNTQTTALAVRHGDNHILLAQPRRQRFHRKLIHYTEEDKRAMGTNARPRGGARGALPAD